LGELFSPAWSRIERRDELRMNLVAFGALFFANFREFDLETVRKGVV